MIDEGNESRLHVSHSVQHVVGVDFLTWYSSTRACSSCQLNKLSY